MSIVWINPDVRMNYLPSPPLVIAYALAGTVQPVSSSIIPSASHAVHAAEVGTAAAPTA